MGICKSLEGRPPKTNLFSGNEFRALSIKEILTYTPLRHFGTYIIVTLDEDCVVRGNIGCKMSRPIGHQTDRAS